MTIVAQEEEIKYETINGKSVLKYKPRVELTIVHTETGREYLSEEEAKADARQVQQNRWAPCRPPAEARRCRRGYEAGGSHQLVLGAHTEGGRGGARG